MKLHLLLLVLVAATAVATESAPTPSESFMHSIQLDENGNYTLYWKFNDEMIMFEVHVRTTGWVGFGLSPNGGMTGSDVVVGWVAANGTAHLKDRFAVDFIRPSIDPHQDWFLISGRKEGGFTILKFHRALDTKDCAYDRVVTRDTLRVIWAFNNQVPANHNDIWHHGATNRGSKSVNLLEPAPNRESPELASAVRFTLTSVNVPVPSNTRTMYHCSVFKAPNVTQKHHLIKYSPLIQKENVAIVHHIILHGCFQANPDAFVGQSYPCFEGAMPVALLRCRYPIALWAVGGGDFYLPDDAGFPFGGVGDPTLLIMEVHYDNPELKTGILDNSGLTMWLTPQLRRHDASVFMFGNNGTPQLAIPRGVAQFTASSVCHSNCTSQTFPPEGVTVFASGLHAHLLGRMVRVRHFRGDKEIGDLGRDNQFDFNYQAMGSFSPAKTIKPGDMFITQCAFDSKARQEVTFGGLESKDEMCLGWIFYYPKVAMSICSSHVNAIDQLRAVHYPNLDSLLMQNNGQLSDNDFKNAMRNVTWSPAMVDLLQKAQTQAGHQFSCASVDPSKNVIVSDAPFPSNLKLMVDPEPDCFPSAAVGHAAGQTAIWLSALSCTLVLISGRLI